jgi:hypothetical protein
MNSNIQQFQDILNDEYEDWKNYRYAVPFEESEYYQIQIQRIAEESGDEYPISGVYFSWLLDLSIFHLQYANYALFDLKNESLAKEHVSLSSEYGYYCLHYGNK